MKKQEHIHAVKVYSQTVLVHKVFLGGLILIAIVLFFTTQPNLIADPTASSVATILPFIIFGAWILGNLMDKNIRARLKPTATFLQKISLFRRIAVIRWALIQSASYMSMFVYYFVDQNIVSLISLLIGMAALWIFRPDVNMVGNEYRLSEEEVGLLREI